MVERKQLTDEMVELWREGCALLDAMTKREYQQGESERYYEYRAIDKRLTWRLVGPHGCSLFNASLDAPPHEYLTPSHLQFLDWPAAQTWRKAVIEATGITARVPSP
jgi:hypothetical protein